MPSSSPSPRLARRALLAAPLALAAGCSARGTSIRSDAAEAAEPLVLRLAHNLSGTHPTSIAIAAFAEAVAEHSQGRIRVDIYASGQLGSETAVLGQLVQGIVDITRVASPGLASYHAGYHAFGLPYVFDSEEQMHQVMDSAEMTDFYRSTQERGFVGLTHYTSGARSFYTKDTAIRHPEDLAGMKIRVQDMRSQTDLMEALGGAPVVMAFGDTYTALQTGLIDGAESNETVLTDSAHGEVAKVFSHTRHTIIPDLMVISSAAWERLAPLTRSCSRRPRCSPPSTTAPHGPRPSPPRRKRPRRWAWSSSRTSISMRSEPPPDPSSRASRRSIPRSRTSSPSSTPSPRRPHEPQSPSRCRTRSSPRVSSRPRRTAADASRAGRRPAVVRRRPARADD